MNLSEPSWQEFVHRPTAVSAFQWFEDMGEIIPQIFKDVTDEKGRHKLKANWGTYIDLEDGDWIVRSPTGCVWAIKKDQFKRYYDPRRKG